MVGAGHPQGGVALHPLEADQDVLEGGVHGVAHVELAGDVGGRHDDGEGLFVRFPVALEAAILLPHLVDAALYLLGLIGFGKFSVHCLSTLLFGANKLYAPEVTLRKEFNRRAHKVFAHMGRPRPMR